MSTDRETRIKHLEDEMAKALSDDGACILSLEKMEQSAALSKRYLHELAMLCIERRFYEACSQIKA